MISNLSKSATGVSELQVNPNPSFMFHGILFSSLNSRRRSLLSTTRFSMPRLEICSNWTLFLDLQKESFIFLGSFLRVCLRLGNSHPEKFGSAGFVVNIISRMERRRGEPQVTHDDSHPCLISFNLLICVLITAVAERQKISRLAVIRHG